MFGSSDMKGGYPFSSTDRNMKQSGSASSNGTIGSRTGQDSVRKKPVEQEVASARSGL